jgi:hypothetical protein
MCGQCGALNQVPASAAGTKVPCTTCGAILDIPAAYVPSVANDGGVPAAPKPPEPPSIPAPPPGLNIAALNPQTPAAPATPSENGLFTLRLNPLWLDWIPVAAITVAFLATFFSWAGSYPGGTRVYSQNPWLALIGEMSVSPLPEVLLEDEKGIEANLRGNRWLILYIPLLFAALGLFWAERFLKDPTATSVPGPLAWLPGIWPQRFPILTGIALALFLLISVQSWRGYGVENAIQARVNSLYAEEEAAADNTAKRQIVAVKKGRELAKYDLEGTTALEVAILAHGFAFAAMAGRWWLHRRGAKQYPAIEFQA